MASSFHETKRLAQVYARRALDEGHLTKDQLKKLKAACYNEFRKAPNDLQLYCALRVKMHDSVESLIHEMAEERGIKYENARVSVVKAIRTLSKIVPREDILPKGCIEIDGELYIARNGFEQGSDFSNARARIDPPLAPVCDYFLKQFYGEDQRNPMKVAASAVELYLIVIQLMPRGDERDFKFNAFATATDAKKMPEMLKDSAQKILKVAQEKGIVIPPDHLRGLQEEKESRKLGAVRMSVYRPAVERHQAVDGALRALLKSLVHEERITPQDAQVYFWMHGGADAAARGPEEAAARFNVPLSQVEEIEDDVRKVLSQQERDIPEKMPALRR